MLRGSVNSVVGTVGLNLPLRAVERLTGAVEHAAAILERLERASKHIEDLDEDFFERIEETLETLLVMRDDTAGIHARMESLEREVVLLRKALSERLDRLPWIRSRRQSEEELEEELMEAQMPEIKPSRRRPKR